MRRNAHDFECATSLAEAANIALDLPPDAMDDGVHWVWEEAVAALDWAENQPPEGRRLNSKERAHVTRLEAENAQLRAQIEKHMQIYREQLYELVDLRTQLDLVRAAITKDGD